VLAWYEQSLKSAGFNVTGGDAGEDGGMITGEDASKRNVIVTVGTEGGQTTVSVAYGNKK
jgi:hypothetical protein